MSATALGLFAIGLPALIVGGLLLMYWPMVQRGFVVVLAAALVYLGLSGIAADVGNRVSVHLPNGVILADAPPVAPHACRTVSHSAAGRSTGRADQIAFDLPLSNAEGLH